MIRMTLHIKVKQGRAVDFERAWKKVADRVRHHAGNLGQALLRGEGDSEFVITSDWVSEEAFHQFERSPMQDDWTAELREMRESARMTTEQLLVHVEGCTPMRARVMVFAKIRKGEEAAFEAAYAQVTVKVKGTPGHIRDELLRDVAEPGNYILLSEWESREAFLAWENAPIHMATTKPMHPYWVGNVQRKLYDVFDPSAQNAAAS